MPKKDTASAILGMLSNTGAHTRPPAEPEKKTHEPAAGHRDGETCPKLSPPPTTRSGTRLRRRRPTPRTPRAQLAPAARDAG